MNEIRFSKTFARNFSKLEARASRGNTESAYLLKIVEKGISKLAVDLENGKKISRKL